MAMVQTTYGKVVRTKEELRALMGEPSERAVKKQMDHLDDHCRTILAHAPFMLLGTANATGWCDVSPKGDAPGFVRVLDERTIAIPDRPGNKRLDSLMNILENPGVGLLFVIPGKDETLRINGRASIVRDDDLLATMAVEDKVPQLAIVVEIEEAYAHCPKSFRRSKLWERESWPQQEALPTMGRMMFDQTKAAGTLEQMEATIEEACRRLY